MRAGHHAVLGTGSWGTAIGVLLARSGAPVRLWGRRREAVERMAGARENRRYLPGVRLPDPLEPVHDLEQALAGCRMVWIVVPSDAFREVLGSAASMLGGVLGATVPIAWGTKGLEPGTGRLLHEVALGLLPGREALAAVSGPTFAAEIARGLPAAVAVAAPSLGVAREVGRELASSRLRAYATTDLAGVCLGGAVKNVLAIATGIADGLGLGANTRAALIARGLHEMLALGLALGVRRETLMGLAGLGDLVLTATDDQSRNRRFGLALGRGESVAAAEAAIAQVVEGRSAARRVVEMAGRVSVEVPIS